MATKDIPKTFDHHILLYSKNWYEKSGDIIADLQVLLEAYSVAKPSERMVKECLANCWAKYCPDFERGRALQDMLGWGWLSPEFRLTPEQIMMGTMGCCEGKYVDPTQLLPVLVKEHSELGNQIIEKCKAEKE